MSAQGFEFKDRLFPIWEECLGGMHVKRHRAQSVCDTGQHQSEGRAKSAVKHDRGLKEKGRRETVHSSYLKMNSSGKSSAKEMMSPQSSLPPREATRSD